MSEELLNLYNYELDESLIAHAPALERNTARLMCLNRSTGDVTHGVFTDILTLLRPGDILVRNNSKVFPARLKGRKQTGAGVELLLLRELEGLLWEVLARPAKKLRLGDKVIFSDNLRAQIVAVHEEGIRHVRFNYSGNFWNVLAQVGEVPLPPYIDKVKAGLNDKELLNRYQTVYASPVGSVAAPTAGLHFTEDLLKSLQQKGVEIQDVTLHVGLGTFRPVKVENIREHQMHSERFYISRKTVAAIKLAKAEGRRIVAVGTTSVRALESCAQKILTEDEKDHAGDTSIFIYPGYEFKIVDALVTNFHLPCSTLVMLVSAFAGREAVLSAYEIAQKSRYRFFSFGDAMLIF